ncbi:bacterial regulatory helix-turn-helix, lysR family protein, partial [Vibrio parahaemolyticus EKP-028]
ALCLFQLEQLLAR